MLFRVNYSSDKKIILLSFELDGFSIRNFE